MRRGYELALRHTSMRRPHLLPKWPNSRSSDLHMLAEAFRANSRSWSTFLDSRRSLTQLQSAGAAKGISPPICLAIGPHRPHRESGAVGCPWGSAWRSHKSSLFFGPPTSDPSTLGESLLWGSSRSCYFVFYPRPLHDHSFGGASGCYLWGSLACFIVLPAPPPY